MQCLQACRRLLLNYVGSHCINDAGAPHGPSPLSLCPFRSPACRPLELLLPPDVVGCSWRSAGAAPPLLLALHCDSGCGGPFLKIRQMVYEGRSRWSGDLFYMLYVHVTGGARDNTKLENWQSHGGGGGGGGGGGAGCMLGLGSTDLESMRASLPRNANFCPRRLLRTMSGHISRCQSLAPLCAGNGLGRNRQRIRPRSRSSPESSDLILAGRCQMSPMKCLVLTS